MRESRYAATVRLCARTVGLAMPEVEYRFAAPRRWRFDFAWPGWRIALDLSLWRELRRGVDVGGP